MELEGPVIGLFSEWRKLERLELDNNKLSGAIPGSFSTNNPLLRILYLDGNEFNGTIPATLGQLPLQDLRLNNNRLTGEIPSSLGNLQSLGTFGKSELSYIVIERFAYHLLTRTMKKYCIYTIIP